MYLIAFIGHTLFLLGEAKRMNFRDILIVQQDHHSVNWHAGCIVRRRNSDTKDPAGLRVTRTGTLQSQAMDGRYRQAYRIPA
jgi:hypothetical protein